MLSPRFDLDAYLRRIGHERPPEADLEALRSVHLAHRLAIPFENLDIQLGEPIHLDLESLQRKLVGSSRGGYCFEHNTLFLQALCSLGFDAIPCEARVRPADTDRITPRTHMVLLVDIAGTEWLADVGFGGTGPLQPIALGGETHEQSGWSYRIVRDGNELVLQMSGVEGWRDQYAFAPEPRYPIDFEVANWYTSTHPESRFVLTLTAQRATPEARLVLNNVTYTRATPAGEESRDVERGELIGLLAERFGIVVPRGARFRALDVSL